MVFSVVIPLYNKERFLSATLSSVELQTFKDFEVIIVDDSSTDNSYNIAKTFEKDKRFKVYTKLNGGVSDTRNFGIEKAVGQYICFLDADDIWDSSYLQEVYRLIKKYPDYDVFCLGYSSFNNVIEDAYAKYNLRKYIKTDDAVIDFFRYSVLGKGSIALTSAVVISKKLIERNQLKFPKGCSMGEDVDFWVRACALKDIVYSNKTLMFYRNSCEDSLTSLGYKSISRSYAYWNWYSMMSTSLYKDKFTTRMLYTTARMGLNTHEGKLIRQCLLKIEGSYLFISRMILFIRSFLI
jgi:glycosyltransferase involved in cell wall biosynthesis